MGLEAKGFKRTSHQHSGNPSWIYRRTDAGREYSLMLSGNNQESIKTVDVELVSLSYADLDALAKTYFSSFASQTLPEGVLAQALEWIQAGVGSTQSRDIGVLRLQLFSDTPNYRRLKLSLVP